MPEDIIRNDPRFPDRPESEDFWLLSEVVREIDRWIDSSDLTFEEIVGQAIDPAALAYIARGRMKHLDADESTQTIGTASYIDGFTAGYRFALRRAEKLREQIEGTAGKGKSWKYG